MARKRKRRGRKTPNAAEMHEAVVSRYLLLREFFRQYPDEVCGGALDKAVIFEVQEELFRSIFRAADYHTAVELAGLPWYDVDLATECPEDLKEAMPHYWKTLKDEGKKIPFPAKLPFDYCYFGFYPAPAMPAQQRVTYDVVVTPGAGVAPYAIWVGILISRQGNVWTMTLASDTEALIGDYSRMAGREDENVVVTLSPYAEYEKGEWTHPLTLAPWIVPALVEWVNDHKVVSVEKVPRTVGFKRLCARANRNIWMPRPVPPDYYAVTMRDQLRMEQDFDRRFPKRKSQTVIDWRHRWLVTAHDRIRVKRGSLPMDPEIEAKLRKPRPSGNSYLIFKDGHPRGELAKELWRRGVEPKRDNEWMAILVSRIEDHIKGPADKPLVPSTRRSGRNRPFKP